MTSDEEIDVSVSGTTTGRTPHLRTAVAAGAGVLTLLLAGCGASDDGPAAEAPAGARADAGDEGGSQGGPRLLQGGEPGQSAEEVPSDTKAPAQEWSQDDATFMQQMIPHHGQALEMTDLVADRSDNRQVRLLAERIAAGQGPEIQVMAAWLDQRELEVPRADDRDAHEGHDDGHGAMAGMLSDAEMDELAAARGAEFDRLFLSFMIRHHEGALEMADETAGGGLDVLVGEQRDGITSTQSAEIARMRGLLDQI